MGRVCVLAIAALAACERAPGPVATADCTAGSADVHIVAQPPRVGDELDYDTTGAGKVTVDGKTFALRTRFAIHERVAEVTGGVVIARDLRFTEGVYDHPDDKDGAEVHSTITGTATIRWQGGTEIYERDGQLLSGDLALMAHTASRNDVGRTYYLVELLTDRTFVEGVETHLTSATARNQVGGPLDAHIVLQGVRGDEATFAIDATTSYQDLPLREHMRVVLSRSTGRLISIELAGELAPGGPPRLTAELTTLEHFRYPAQSPPLAPTTGCTTR